MQSERSIEFFHQRCRQSPENRAQPLDRDGAHQNLRTRRCDSAERIADQIEMQICTIAAGHTFDTTSSRPVSLH